MHPLFCLFAMGVAAAPAAEPDEATIRKSIVRVTATIREPDISYPWRKKDPYERNGSGVVIEGKRILTSAHLVTYGTQVLIEPDQTGEKLPAKVVALAPSIDLAILVPDDSAFFDAHPPMRRSSSIPAVKETVLTYGYPHGGDSLSITKGIVSRVEFDDYYYDASGLRVQVDAAINEGNSGGPALVDGRMVGIIFSRLNEADNIGYIIPNEEIDIFLEDLADGNYDGKPALFDVIQPLENPALRDQLKLDRTTTGVMVCGPFPPEASHPLRVWDVITKIGPHEVDNLGKVRVDGLRLHFKYCVQKLLRDGRVPLTVLREGKTLEMQVPVEPKRGYVFPLLLGRYPSYFVLGPLVLSPVTMDFLYLFDENAAAWFPPLTFRSSPLVLRRGDLPHFVGEELVAVSSPMLPHRLTKGYTDCYSLVVEKVNGVPIRNLRHLVELVRDATDEKLVITFADKSTQALVFNRREVLDATEQICADASIHKPCSDDLKAVWTRKP